MIIKERITSQKIMILDYLKSVKTHPSAENVYLAVKEKLPRISRATVYRILNGLKEKGEIVELNFKKFSRYDGDITSHAHFFCEKCKEVFDIFDKFEMPKLEKKVGKIKNYKIYIYGICKKCGEK